MSPSMTMRHRIVCQLAFAGALWAAMAIPDASLAAEDVLRIEAESGEQSVADALQNDVRHWMSLEPDGVWRLAAENNRCGVNAVYLLLRAQGHSVDYEELVDSFAVPESGASLLDLTTLLERSGYAAIPAKLSRSDALSLGSPFIAHWEGGPSAISGHYVLVLHCNEAALHVIDGTTARRYTISWPDFSRNWTGYAIIPDDTLQRMSLMVAALIVVLLACLYAISRRWKEKGVVDDCP